jgi:hypothetical protein
MRTTTLREPVTFWPDRIAPYRLQMREGEPVFLILDEGEKVLVSLSPEPTAGDTRWVSRELVTL